MDKIGHDNYIEVYKSANDSLNSFASNRLYNFKDITQTKWILDSLICFNSSRDKYIISFNVTYGNEASNGLNYLYGINVKSKWYFIRGQHIFIQSENYGYASNTPLSFEKLHEIAMKQIYAGYQKPKVFGLGGYEINEGFFQDITSVAWYPGAAPQTQVEWDKIYLKIVGENWAKKDTTIY